MVEHRITEPSVLKLNNHQMLTRTRNIQETTTRQDLAVALRPKQGVAIKTDAAEDYSVITLEMAKQYRDEPNTYDTCVTNAKRKLIENQTVKENQLGSTIESLMIIYGLPTQLKDKHFIEVRIEQYLNEFGNELKRMWFGTGLRVKRMCHLVIKVRPSITEELLRI